MTKQDNQKESAQHLIEMNHWLIDGLDILADLTKDFQSDIYQSQDLNKIYNITQTAIQKIINLKTICFFGLEQDGINMEQVASYPSGQDDFFNSLLEKTTDDGTFGWALCENRLVTVPDKEQNHTILLHVLATNNKVLGMLVGTIDIDTFVSDAAKKLISVILLDTAHTIESIELMENVKSAERMRQEVESAAKIQASLLPAGDLKLKQAHVLGHCQPSAQIGGDYYDFFAPCDDLLNLSICDIAGHGVPAGLFMTMVRSVIRTLGHSKTNPLKMISYLNNFLHKEIPDPAIFVTGIYAQFHTEEKRLNYVIAGHPAPWVVKADKTISELKGSGIAMGIIPNAPYKVETALLEKGDTVVFFTDGLYELKTKAGPMLGENGLKNMIQKIDWTSAPNGVKQLFAELDKHNQEDDQTVLVLKVAN